MVADHPMFFECQMGDFVTFNYSGMCRKENDFGRENYNLQGLFNMYCVYLFLKKKHTQMVKLILYPFIKKFAGVKVCVTTSEIDLIVSMH